MKAICILAALLLFTGCASVKSLEQLESEAMMSGNWSAVEKRERLLARRSDGVQINCPVGYSSLCRKTGGQSTCGCVTRRGLEDVFAGR